MDSGYSLINDIYWATLDNVETPGCYKQATSPTGPTYPEYFPTTTDVMVHNAYRISWDSSDTASMTPQPPDLTCGTMMTWVPGSPATSSPCPTHYNDSPPGYGAIGFLQIGLPIIIIFGIAFLGGCCCYYPYKEREEKRMQERRAARAAREQDEAIRASQAESPAASPGQS